MRARFAVIVLAVTLVGSACSTASAPSASWLPAGPASVAALKGLTWLRTHADPAGAGRTELASVLDYIRRRAGRPRGLAWVERVTIRARAEAARATDPQGLALTRLLGAAPTPVDSPATTTANTINKLLSMALWCDAYPTPVGYDAALAASPSGTPVTVVAAAGATQLLLERGCRSPGDLAPVRAELARALGRLARQLPIGDASLQVAAMLSMLGRPALVPDDWIARVVRAQRSDGSWPARRVAGSSREPWRATAWAVRSLVDHQLRSAPVVPLLPDSEQRLAPVPATRVPDPLPGGSLTTVDRDALHALSVRDPNPITQPAGGTPFGQDAGHPHVNLPVADPATRRRLDQELAAARAAAGALDRVSNAIDAGYVLGSAFIPSAGAHWIKWSLVDRPFDPARPSMILFDGDGPDAQLVAFSYVVRSVGRPPEGFAGTADRWHQHFGICFANGRLVGSDILSAGDCEVLGLMTSASPAATHADLLDGRDLWMLHAWIVADHANPAGLFTSSNPDIQCPECPAWLPGRELG